MRGRGQRTAARSPPATEGNAPSPGKLFDINLLVMTGGRERTEREFRELFAASGFELARVVRAGATDIIEGRPTPKPSV